MTHRYALLEPGAAYAQLEGGYGQLDQRTASAGTQSSGDTPMQQSPQWQALMRQVSTALGFSHDDLMANRRGQIHAAQLRKHATGCLTALNVSGAGVAVAALIIGPIAADALREDVGIGLAAGALVAALFALMSWSGIRYARRIRAAFRAGRVSYVDARVVIERSGRRNRTPTYRLCAGQLRFAVDQKAVAVPRANYRVYYVEDRLMSLEPLGLS